MKKQLAIDLLEFLETEDGIPLFKNIYPFIKQNGFKKPENLEDTVDNDHDSVKLLILDLINDELIESLNDTIYHICNRSWTNPIGNKSFQYWFDDIEVQLKISGTGQDYLDDERVKNILLETNKSIQLSNKSTIETNDLVKTNIKVQIAMGFLTLLAIAITAIVAVMAYTKDDSSNMILIRKSIQRQEQLLDSMRQSQKEISIYLKSMAKKTLPKKK